MKEEIQYVENKNTGEAWIGFCQFSKSGRSVYFNNKVFKRANVITGNHFDIVTGEEYWISGIKKNGKDRHFTEPGKINIDSTAIAEYLKIVELETLPKGKFAIVELINQPNKELSRKIANTKLE